MPFAGHTMMGRQFCGLIAGHWPNSKVKAIATGMSESLLSVGAWHDNQTLITDCDEGQIVCNVETLEPMTVVDPARGKVMYSHGEVVSVPLTTLWITSRDCGAFQNSIAARFIGTTLEWSLRSEEKDEAIFMPVLKNNIDVAYSKWTDPWIRDGKKDFRRWQPWYGYTTGWAMFPEAYVWKQVVSVEPTRVSEYWPEEKMAQKHPALVSGGTPVGPWVPTGRFLHKAIRAVANWHYVIAKDMSDQESLAEGQRLASSYGITKGDLYFDSKSFVTWKFPPTPTEPPSDGVGPRPKRNNGI